MGKLILNHIFLHEEQYVILTWNFMQLIHKLLLQLGEGILPGVFPDPPPKSLLSQRTSPALNAAALLE